MFNQYLEEESAELEQIAAYVPLRRLDRSVDAANAVAFLAALKPASMATGATSSIAYHLNGTNLPVNGGMDQTNL